MCKYSVKKYNKNKFNNTPVDTDNTKFYKSIGLIHQIFYYKDYMHVEARLGVFP